MYDSSDPDPASRPRRPGVAVYTCFEVLEGPAKPTAAIGACIAYARKYRLVDSDSPVPQYLEPVNTKPRSRPILRDLLQAAGRGEFGLVVLYSLQSISRGGPDEQWKVVRMIEGSGAEVRSAHDPWLDSSRAGAAAVRAALDWAFGAKGDAHAKRVSEGVARSRATAVRRGGTSDWGRARGATLAKDTALVSEIVRLRDSGLSLSKTATAVGKPKTTVARLERIGRNAGERDKAPVDADVPASE